MKTYKIKTYGCQMNYSDTERVKTMLENLGFNESRDKADIVIFNTCSVKQKAEDKVLGQMENMKRSRRERQNLLIGITGCMVRKTSSRNSKKKDQLINKVKELDFVFRIEDLPRLPEILNELDARVHHKVGNLENYFNVTPKYNSRFQAFVPIGTGCDKFCTYCIVPYSRGREKSRNPQEIFDECQKLVGNGCIEITLLGQTVNSYGLSDIDKRTGQFKEEYPFSALLRRIDALKDKGLKRLRFTSPHPKDFSDELIRTISKLETLMPYLHLPLQSGDNDVLKRMNRSYTRERFLEIVEKIRENIPDCAISTDIIVGFCGESEEQFMNTYNLFKEIEFDLAYISKYSPRKGTLSERLMEDTVSREDKTKRWHKLNQLLKKTSKKKLRKFIGKTVGVLVEECEDGICSGKSEHFKKVNFKGSKELVGKIVKVKVTSSDQWSLTGQSANHSFNTADSGA